MRKEINQSAIITIIMMIIVIIMVKFHIIGI